MKKPDIREQVLKQGISYPTDEELIMLILGKGIKGVPIQQLAARVISVLHGTNDNQIVQNLLTIKGIGTSRALALAASIELGRRYTKHLQSPIKKPEDILPYVQQYAIEQKEHFLAITLNGAHEIIKIRVISIGTLNRTLIHPREIFSEALTDHAAAIIVCHNHPSGNTSPSNEDIETTQILIKASQILGISLLDHLIIGRQSYYSFADHKLLFN